MNFAELFKKLHNVYYEVGYEKYLNIEYNHYSDYFYCDYDNGDVRFCFCEQNNGNSQTNVDGKIAIENSKCFDKWSKVPCSLPFPGNEIQFKFLLWNLDFWGSKDGYRISNEYIFEEYIFEYPSDEEIKKLYIMKDYL